VSATSDLDEPWFGDENVDDAGHPADGTGSSGVAGPSEAKRAT
jgi:hypothetical protein